MRTAERLRDHWPADIVAAATQQAELRRRAADKFSRASDMLFTRDGLEQASSEPVARHRAARIAATRPPLVLDLCCGVGGDLLALGHTAPTVVGVDRDETHAILARHNAAVFDAGVHTVAADVHDIRVPARAAVFVDPARRRAGGGRTVRGGYAPPLEWAMTRPTQHLAVKAAPGLDAAIVPPGWEIEFVARGRELKEAVLWSPAWATATRRATVLDETGAAAELIAGPATPDAPVRAPGAFLLDPSPAVTRAGAVADLAGQLGAWQVDPKIAFLSADHELRTPFGRGLRIEASLPFAVKTVAAELRRLDVGSLDIRRRGLAGDVEEMRRRFHPRGHRRATVVLTRVANRPWTFICADLETA